MSFYKQLAKIQAELKAPKNQRNNFGNYNYRSCEDILEAVKKVKGDLVLTISDDVVLIGDRVYVKATATITDGEHLISNSAFAREALNKKGMDEAQITGSASSYARKYALNGLFCIDDTQDADATNQHGKGVQQNVKSELLEVMADGNDIATAKYWRSLSQEKQSVQWDTIDKESQKQLKEILKEHRV